MNSGGIDVAGYDAPAPVGDPFGAGVRAREQFRRVSIAQSEILRNIVLYTPPEATLDFDRLVQEYAGPLLASAKQFRAWLAQHPEAHITDPRAVDVADLTCEDS